MYRFIFRTFFILSILVASISFLGKTDKITYQAKASTDITSTSFTVPVSTFSPMGTGLISGGSSGNVDSLLARVLNALILLFGVAAVFFMTIGAGYMIIYHGQDELLSKGKTIFTSGLIALVVALSAGLIVRLFIFLLYN